MGGSATIEAISVGIEGFTGTARNGDSVVGGSLGVGASIGAPIEWHGEVTYTKIIPIWVFNKSGDNNYFETIECEE